MKNRSSPEVLCFKMLGWSDSISMMPSINRYEILRDFFGVKSSLTNLEMVWWCSCPFSRAAHGLSWIFVDLLLYPHASSTPHPSKRLNNERASCVKDTTPDSRKHLSLAKHLVRKVTTMVVLLSALQLRAYCDLSSIQPQNWCEFIGGTRTVYHVCKLTPSFHRPFFEFTQKKFIWKTFSI